MTFDPRMTWQRAALHNLDDIAARDSLPIVRCQIGQDREAGLVSGLEVETAFARLWAGCRYHDFCARLQFAYARPIRVDGLALDGGDPAGLTRDGAGDGSRPDQFSSGCRERWSHQTTDQRDRQRGFHLLPSAPECEDGEGKGSCDAGAYGAK